MVMMQKNTFNFSSKKTFFFFITFFDFGLYF